LYRRYKHESKVEKLSAGKESGQINTQRKPSDKAWAVNKMFKTLLNLWISGPNSPIHQWAGKQFSFC
jgi:hypothetical protein